MSPESRASIKCFEDNSKKFKNADLEKYNLYYGLAKLAHAMADVEAELKKVRDELKYIAARMKD